MAVHRPEISNAAKKRLRTEAGHKCANPGCANTRTHIHHIREWAAYRTHDEHHMIAVCPSCHDAIHTGRLSFTDEQIYSWKDIRRSPGITRAHVYVEPGNESKLLLGSIAVTAPKTSLIFELSPSHRLRFSVHDREIVLIELVVSTTSGKEILRVMDNHVRHKERADVSFAQVPGTMTVTAPATDEFIPAWALAHMQHQEPKFAAASTITLLSITVLKPGLVRIEGVWSQPNYSVIVTKDRLAFLRPELQQPISLVGAGESTVLHHTANGVLDLPLFGFDGNSVLKIGPPRHRYAA